MLTLFAAKNTVAFASHIALEETGLPYQVSWVDFASGDQTKPDFLAVNPKGRVPALAAEGGILTETPAILDYIAETSGQLMPAAKFERAKVREMTSYCASTFHINHAHKLRGSRWSDDPNAHASMQAKVPETMGASCAYIDSLLTQDWVAGTYSIADIHVHTICRWLGGDGVDITNFPNLSAHFDRMQARPAVAHVTTAHG